MDDRVQFGIEMVDVGAAGDQPADDDLLAGDDGQVQRRIALVVGGIDQLRLGAEEQLDALGRHVLGAVVQRRLARPVAVARPTSPLLMIIYHEPLLTRPLHKPSIFFDGNEVTD